MFAEIVRIPDFYLFLILTCFPLVLWKLSGPELRQDHGLRFMLLGWSLVAVAGLVDFVEEIPATQYLDQSSIFGVPFDGAKLAFLYLPGLVLFGYGLARWLPAIRQLKREIVQRKEAEARLQQLLEESRILAARAEEASKAKTSFLANMSHELKTPLNAIIGFAEILREKMEEEKRSEDEEFAGHIQENGAHLLSLVNNILDMTHLEAGQMQVDMREFPLIDEVTACQEAMSRIARNKGVAIVVRCEDTVVTTDRRIVRQILNNLVSNSIKCSSDGDQITVEGSVSEGAYHLAVADQGSGMSADDLEIAMQPFSQVEDSFTRSYEGAGLGLPLVHKYARLIGASFSIESEPDVGTRAEVRMPVQP